MKTAYIHTSMNHTFHKISYPIITITFETIFGNGPKIYKNFVHHRIVIQNLKKMKMPGKKYEEASYEENMEHN